MGQSLVGGLIGGAGGAIQGFITGGPAGALALGTVGFVGGFASSYMAKQATADALSSAMGPSATEPKFGGYNVNRRGAALHHQVIYGQTKVGGVVVFDDAGGTNNEDLSRVIAFAGHEIEAFEKIYLGQYELTLSGDSVTSAQQIDANGDPVGSSTTKFNNYIKVRQVLGDHTTRFDQGNQGTFSNFSSKWTTSHKLLGIAHLAIIFTYADDVWDEGLPEVTALVKGKKVFDPRTSTTAWSANPALLVRDFLTDGVYGLGEDAANIDDTRISTAANLCEEDVDVTDPDNPPAVITADRYTANGAFTTSQAPVDVIAQLMTSCAGYLWYAQGKWRIKAGSYVAPTITLEDDDLRSPLSVATRHSRRDNFNTVRGTYRGPKTNYQFTDYPAVTASTFLAEDNNEESVMDLALPFTDTPEEAQRLANIALEKNREQITVTASFGMKAFELQVGDNVNITNSRFGWTNKLFEVVAWSLSFEGYELLVNLVLRETTNVVYDEFQDVSGFLSNNTDLPGVLGEVADGGVNETTDVTGLTAESGLLQIKVSWSNPINNSYKHTKIYQHGTALGTPTNVVNTVVGESVVRSYPVLQANNIKYFWAQAVDTDDNDLGALVGPISAVVGVAGQDDIGTNAVATEKIVNHAVTEPRSDQLSNPIVGIADFSTETLSEISFAPDTGEVLVSWDAFITENKSGDPRVNFAVQRVQSGNSATLQSFSNVVVSVAQTYSGSLLDTGVNTGSTATYKLLFDHTDTTSGNINCEDANITATELKR